MIFVVLLGLATGMRSMTAMAVVCWAAHFGLVPVQGTWAFWAASLVSAIVFTVFALGEYVGDTLPQAPSRAALGPMLVRVAFGAVVGAIAATGLKEPKAGGILFAEIGVLAGVYAGVRCRLLCAKLLRHDLPVALLESALAVALCVLAVHMVGKEIFENAIHATLVWPL